MSPEIICPAVAVIGDKGIATGEEATVTITMGVMVGEPINSLRGLKSGTY